MMPSEAAIEVGVRLDSISAKTLMLEKPMLRTVFRGMDHLDGQGSSWVRVRIGDMDNDGKSRCRLTYKLVEKMADVKVERIVDLAVESYDECVELLSRVGLVPISRQETRRSKYLCLYGDASYTVSVDIWPWLEDLRFVSVEPLDGISPDSLEDFLDFLGLNEYTGYKGGVDGVYKERLGFEVSTIADVRFNIPVPEGGTLKNINDFKQSGGSPER
jgi:hypothetical protein